MGASELKLRRRQSARLPELVPHLHCRQISPRVLEDPDSWALPAILPEKNQGRVRSSRRFLPAPFSTARAKLESRFREAEAIAAPTLPKRVMPSATTDPPFLAPQLHPWPQTPRLTARLCRRCPGSCTPAITTTSGESAKRAPFSSGAPRKISSNRQSGVRNNAATPCGVSVPATLANSLSVVRKIRDRDIPASLHLAAFKIVSSAGSADSHTSNASASSPESQRIFHEFGPSTPIGSLSAGPVPRSARESVFSQRFSRLVIRSLSSEAHSRMVRHAASLTNVACIVNASIRKLAE